ncbi:hypothetical protein BDY19DRAFT_911913, partial [Irpex rosettiformis]
LDSYFLMLGFVSFFAIVLGTCGFADDLVCVRRICSRGGLRTYRLRLMRKRLLGFTLSVGGKSTGDIGSVLNRSLDVYYALETFSIVLLAYRQSVLHLRQHWHVILNRPRSLCLIRRITVSQSIVLDHGHAYPKDAAIYKFDGTAPKVNRQSRDAFFFALTI